MKTSSTILILLTGLFCQVGIPLSGQIVGQSDPMIIDRVVAVVGKYPILQSDLEDQVLQAKQQGIEVPGDIKCFVLESLLVNKLLVTQSEIDSIFVEDDEVKREVENRIQSMLARFEGSVKQIEEMFNKPMPEITKDLFKPMKEQLIVRRMQQEIYKNLEVTPAEVQKFYRKIPESQLPLRPESIEIREITLKPAISESEIARVQDRLKEFRDRIQKGESMSTLAALYSEDQGSALRGGELGLTARGSLVPEFAAVAFNLKGDEVSRIVKTDFGYHIIQMIDRRGDMINVRHILLVPKPTAEEKLRIKTRLDSIAQVIREGKIKFEDAALRYSTEKNTRFNGGLVVNSGNSQNSNPQNEGTTWFEPQELAPEVLNAIRNLKVGEISAVFESRDENNNLVYKIVSVKSRRPAHRADIRQDYQFLQNLALQEKQQNTLNEWIAKKQATMFIRIDPDFRGCEFQSKGWLK